MSGGNDAEAGPETQPDASDAGCPMSWSVVPGVDPSIALPDAGSLLLHVTGVGTQDYKCTATVHVDDAGLDAGVTYAWVFVGPEATLDDCMGNAVGMHFASEGGPGQPEWQTTGDNSWVIAKKALLPEGGVNNGFTPDGGAGVPWLLLKAFINADAGDLSQVTYIQRLDTDGGLSPANSTCSATNVTTVQKVGYTADYYFFGP